MKKGQPIHASHGDEGWENDVEEFKDGDYDDRPLNEMDIISEANLLEGTFRTVLSHVRDWTNDVSISLHSDLSRANHNGSSGDDNMNGPSHKRMFDSSDDTDGVDCPRKHINAFEQWRENVLYAAKLSVMGSIKEGDKRDWLTIAADEVLGKAGL